MPVNIRPRGLAAFEVRITHRRLPKPFYRNVSSRLEAEQLAARLTAMLDQGVFPDELKKDRSGEASRARLQVRRRLRENYRRV